MKWILNATLITLSLTGCIVYDEELNFEDDFNHPSDRQGSSDPGENDNAQAQLTLSPNQGSRGELVLTSLLSDDGTDLHAIEAITFYGESDIVVVAEQDRGQLELLLAIDIANNASLGPNHLLVEFADGDEVFISDAFTVLD